jgi:hypothetical protein
MRLHRRLTWRYSEAAQEVDEAVLEVDEEAG